MTLSIYDCQRKPWLNYFFRTSAEQQIETVLVYEFQRQSSCDFVSLFFIETDIHDGRKCDCSFCSSYIFFRCDQFR